MRSGLFYPLAFLAIAVIIGGALYPGVLQQRRLAAHVDHVREDGFIIQGDAITEFVMIDGVTVLVMDNGAYPRARLLATRERLPPLGGSGAFVIIPPPIADLFAGNDIIVSINARSASATPSPQYSAMYMSMSFPTNEWHTIEPLPTFTEQSFRYSARAGKNPQGAMIGIWPDTSGGRGAIEVLSIRIELAQNRPGA